MHLLVALGSAVVIFTPTGSSLATAGFVIIVWYVIPFLFWFIHTEPAAQRHGRDAFNFTFLYGLLAPIIYWVAVLLIIGESFGTHFASQIAANFLHESAFTTIRALIELLRQQQPDNSQWLWFVALPGLIYCVLLILQPLNAAYHAARDMRGSAY